MLFPILLGTQDWSLTYERSNFLETGSYQESVDFCRRLAKASPFARVVSYGRSPQGREMLAILISSEKSFSPAALAESKRPLIFIQNGIHSGEIEGKDASLILARDLVVAKKQPKLLEGANFLIVPIFSVDAHERFSAYNRINQNGPKEMGFRASAQNLNLNRDWMKADAPEMRAEIQLIHRYRPDFFFDNHTTDGADYPYVLTLSVQNTPYLPPTLAKWQTRMYEAIKPQTDRDGFLTAPYLSLADERDPGKGIRVEDFGPRYSHGYWGTLNRPSMLVETHVLKPYRARVEATYSVMARTIGFCIQHRDELKAMNQTFDALERNGTIYSTLSTRLSNESRPFTFIGHPFTPYKSEITGGTIRKWDRSQTVTYPTRIYDQYLPGLAVNPPDAYAIPPEWLDAIDRLSLHGLQFKRLRKPYQATVETYRFNGATFPAAPFEGRFQPRFTTSLVNEPRTLPVGTVIVEVKQAGGRRLLHLLEPDAPDSLMKWGFFNNIFEQKEYAEDYAMEPVGKEMLAKDPKLKAEFDAKIAADPEFARSPSARLRWLFERSRYYDDRLAAYPIVRLRQSDLDRISR